MGLANVKVRFKDGYIAEGGFPTNFYYDSDPAKYTVELDEIKGTSADFTNADKMMRKKDPMFVRPKGYTWNHAGAPGSRKMELIKSAYHKEVAHSGNAAEIRRAVRLNKELHTFSCIGGAFVAQDTIDKIRLIASANENIVDELAELNDWIAAEINNNRPSRAEIPNNELETEIVDRVTALIIKYDGNTSSLRMMLKAWWYNRLGNR